MLFTTKYLSSASYCPIPVSSHPHRLGFSNQTSIACGGDDTFDLWELVRLWEAEALAPFWLGSSHGKS